MRVAIISTMLGARWGGSEELWAQAAREALARGDEVMVSVFKWSPRPVQVEALARGGAIVCERPRLRSLRFARLRSRLFFDLQAVVNFRPDVILISGGGTYEWMSNKKLAHLERVTRGWTVPFVFLSQFHDDTPTPSLDVAEPMRVAFTKAAAVLFVAGRNLDVCRIELGLPLSNARVVRNPFNLKETSIVAWPAEKGPTRFASVARLDPRLKGHDLLLGAFARPEWRDRDWELTLYGQGPGESEIRQWIAEKGLGDRVSLGGHVDDIRAVWARHHALVLPSRAEGTPLAVVEAMLCGRPVIATDVGGVAECVTEGESGFLAAEVTAAAFAAALDRAWSARERWETMGQVAHEAATRLYDPHAGATLLRILDEAAGSRRGV